MVLAVDGLACLANPTASVDILKPEMRLPRTRHQAPSKWHKGNLEDTGDKAGDKGKQNEMIEIHSPFSSVSICLTLENWYEILSRGYQSIQLPVPSFLKKYLRH